jgi:hypothetical protein
MIECAAMDLNGDWFNELGSKMTLIVAGGNITGKYHTAVGDAEGIYDLVGRLSEPPDENRTLGFVVSWQNEKRAVDSATSWSGEAREINGNEVILTTWLLTLETSPNDDWKSTIVGKDAFTRNPPSREDMEHGRLMRATSHHPRA